MRLNALKRVSILSCLLILGTQQFSLCQISIKDSLESNLEGAYPLEVYKEFFNDLESDFLSSLKDHIDKFVALSQKHGDVSLLMNAKYTEFRFLKEQGFFEEALLLADTISSILDLSKQNDAALNIKLNLDKSIIHENKGNVEKAVELNYRLIDNIDNSKALSDEQRNIFHYKNYSVLSSNYLFENDSLSYDYAKKSEYHARVLKNPNFIYESINLTYYCNYFGNDGDLLNSIADSCILYAERLDDYENLGEAYMHKCNALVVLKQENQAEVYCEKAASIYSESNDPEYLSSVYNNIANVFEKTKDPYRSLVYYEKSFRLAKDLKNGSGYLTPLNNLAEKYLNLAEYRLSAEHYKMYADSQKVYYENLLSSQFAEAEAKYQSDQKEIEIANQKFETEKQKARANGILLASSIVFIIGFGSFQWYRNRQSIIRKKAELNLEKERFEAEQLRNLDKIKTQFFTNVSHELRTPLTLIAGPLKNIIDKNQNSESIKKDLELAYANSNKLHNLVSEILDLSKLESGKMKVNAIPVQLNALVNRITSAFTSYAHSKKVNFHINNRIGSKIFVSIDAEKLETIINNLISNAIKFTDSGKKVIFDAAENAGSLFLYVKDEGMGIPDGDEEKIFERFYQSEQDLNNLSGGTGVGLALCNEIASLLKGELSAANNLNGGATFTLTLPLNYVEEIAPTLKEEEKKTLDKITYRPLLINGERPRILIVEDNPDMRNYIFSILKPYYECSFANNGYECLQLVQREKFDIISSDVMMPKMDGFTLKQKINEMERFKQIPFIFLTARILEEDKIRGLNLGVDDYITKPFSKQEYLTRIHNLLNNKVSREEEKVESIDRRTIKTAESWILKNLSDSSIKVQGLAEALNISQRQLGRDIKKLTGLTPVNFILEIRLQKSYRMLLERKYASIAEIRYDIGIESASYFTKKFKERFGLLPSEVK